MHKKPLVEHYQDFRDALLMWFKDYQRDMPWRNTDDPYRIWVSEVMLQQTQVKKVVDYYEKFVARFPNVSDLAAAPLQDVLKVWEGLGYYARARNLHKAAQVIVNELDGEVPRDYAIFRKFTPVSGIIVRRRCRVSLLTHRMLRSMGTSSVCWHVCF